MPSLVSVIIPAYNAERWVEASVESVLAQDYPRFEVIVVDDGSTDGTGRAIERFHGRVRHVRQENSGVCRARNRGAAEGNGNLLAFLDADDLWLPGKLSAQVRRLSARPEAVASFTGAIAFDESSGREELLPSRIRPDLVMDLLLNCAVIGPPSAVVIRREIFERVGGFDPTLSNCADWDMWIRLAGVGPIDLIEDLFVRYRVHPGSMSTSVPLLEADTLRLLEKFFSEPANAAKYAHARRQVYSNQYLVLSGSHLHSGNIRASLAFLVRAVLARPSALFTALGWPARAVGRFIGSPQPRA